MSGGLVFFVIVTFIVLVAIVKTAVIVPQKTAYIIERLGKYRCTLDAGFHILIPFFDRVAYRHTLKEQAIDVPPQQCITKDNIAVDVDGILYMQVMDPAKASYGIGNYLFATTQLAQTTMRSEMGKLDLDRSFEERTSINAAIVAAVDKASDPWGIKVTRYEIKNITPPQTIRDAMEKQMRAEREKRAMIAESEGERQSKINRAEGERQQAIALSEGERARRINEAEGKAKEILLVAEAQATGIQKVAEAINGKGGIESVNMQLAQQYLAQFGNLAKVNNTMIIPSNLADVAGVLKACTSVVKKVEGKVIMASSLLFAALAPLFAVTLPLSDEVAREKAEAVLAKLSLDQKVSLLGGCATMYLNAIPEAGISREWAMSDCSHAVKPEHRRNDFGYVPGADEVKTTTLPPLSALAMTWNRELASLHGTVMAEQMRSLGKDQMLGPGVNINRTPLCGRNWEYMSEDPFLASKLVVPLIKAVQAGGVAATVKHFCLNAQELNRMAVDMAVDERTLHEIFLPAFRAAVVDAGALSVMTAYNKVNGTFCSENAYLQQGILRDRWGFKGMIVSDWGGQHSGVFSALNGGNCEMHAGGAIVHFTDHFKGRLPLAEAVRKGELTEATVDEMVLHILWTMAKTGFFDGLQPAGRRLVEEHRAAGRAIAAEAVTLLKNDHQVLPLKRAETKRVVVLGKQADLVQCQLGSSCESRTENEITPYMALCEYLPGAEVKLYPLGLEAGGGTGAPQTIPLLSLETFRPSTADSAYAERGWELWQWPEGRKWVDWPKLVGYRDYPSGEPGEALRYVAKVRFGEGGFYSLPVTAGVKAREATILLDGEVVTTLRDGHMDAKAFKLARDSVHTVQVDVAGCPVAGGFDFGWLTPGAYAGGKEAKFAACRAADAVVVFTGTQMGGGRAMEQEGDDLLSMSEPLGHDEEIADLLKMGLKNLVVVHRSGTPMEMPWADDCPTLVQTPYLGQEGSRSLAKVLFGEINPSGKLTATWPRRYADTPVAQAGSYAKERSVIGERIFVGYRWYEAKKIAPLFPFGYGLSYTRFAYSPAVAEPVKGAKVPTWKVALKVTNAGAVAGKETVELYVAPVAPPVERPVKELKGFAKTEILAAGETAAVELEVSAREFAFYDVFLHRWRAAKGTYALEIGASSADIRSRAEVTLAEDVVFDD